MINKEEVDKTRRLLNTIIGRKVTNDTRECLRLYKATISTAYDTQAKTCGVKLVGDETEITAKCTRSMAQKVVGDVVWVAMPFSNARNAVVWGDSGLNVGGLIEYTGQTFTVLGKAAGVYLWTYNGQKYLQSKTTVAAVALPTYLTGNVIVEIQEESSTVTWLRLTYERDGVHTITNRVHQYSNSSFSDHLKSLLYMELGESDTSELFAQGYEGDYEMSGYIDTAMTNLVITITCGTLTVATFTASSYTVPQPIFVRITKLGVQFFVTIAVGNTVQNTNYNPNRALSAPIEFSFTGNYSEQSCTLHGREKIDMVGTLS